MVKIKAKDDYPVPERIEFSRRGFLGRFAAVGAALTLGAPAFAEAATPKNQGPVKRAVRLPKQRVSRSPKMGIHTSAVQKHHSHYHGAGKHLKGRAAGPSDLDREHSLLQTNLREPWLESSQDAERLSASAGFPSYRALAFKNPHTGDSLNLTYFEKGEYLSDALSEISYLLRDYRIGDVHPIDPELLDQLHDLKQMLGLNQPFQVICGYRSPATNAQLHAEHAGVASNSFHIYGRAVDVRLERFDLRRAHNAAVAMHRGGVGYYPNSNFIHLDTGSFRTWSL